MPIFFDNRIICGHFFVSKIHSLLGLLFGHSLILFCIGFGPCCCLSVTPISKIVCCCRRAFSLNINQIISSFNIGRKKLQSHLIYFLFVFCRHFDFCSESLALGTSSPRQVGFRSQVTFDIFLLSSSLRRSNEALSLKSIVNRADTGILIFALPSMNFSRFSPRSLFLSTLAESSASVQQVPHTTQGHRP